MAYSVKILADSVNATTADRLTTFECTYPRFVHAELMTHRMFSRNSSSSRAIPIEKLIGRVIKDPVLPVYWGKNQKGMQANEELTEIEQLDAKDQWLDARDKAVESAMALSKLGVHKQIVNRLIEPWMWITVLITATEFENFFALRCHPDAQPEIRHLADLMREAYITSEPRMTKPGEWHLPLIQAEDWAEVFAPDPGTQAAVTMIKKICVARCARVSYLTHDGKRDLALDVELHDKLAESGHWSPFEHAAEAMQEKRRAGNFAGWFQYRKEFANENRGRSLDGRPGSW